ncbi:MAG: mu-protocadherin, partial [Rhodopirellula sp. JB053]
PDPQSGGMNLPGGFGMTPATNSAPPSTSFSQTAQDAANDMANQFRGAIDTSRQQMEQTLNNATDRLGQDASAQMQATANNLRDSASQLFNNNTAANDPDDPRSRLGQNSYSATDSASRPSTDPYNRSTTPRSGFPSTDSNATPFATSRAGLPSTSTTSASRSASTTSGSDDWYDLRNGSRRRPSTDPVDSYNSSSTNGGALASGNFGRLPSGLQSDSAGANSRSADNSSRSTYANASYPDSNQRTANTTSNGSSSNVEYDPNLTPAQAARLPKNGYSFDAENYPVDKQGYRLDQYGRRVDRQGRLLSATDTMSGPNSNSNDSRSNQNLYGQTGNQPNSGLYANQMDRSSSVATTGPPALGNTSNFNNGYPGNTNTNGGASQLVQPPLAPNTGQYANNGQRPTTQFPMSQFPTSQFPTSQYPTSQYPTSQYPTSQYPTSPYPGGPNIAGNGAQPNLSPTLAPGMPGYPQYPDPRLASLTGQNNASNSGNASNITSNSSEDRTNSSSDRDTRSDRLTSTNSALTDRSRDSAYTPEQVAAQPIFNALLLLSVVANVYLLFWLKNLRLQFRDMVATKRSNNANKSLATSV